MPKEGHWSPDFSANPASHTETCERGKREQSHLNGATSSAVKSSRVSRARAWPEAKGWDPLRGAGPPHKKHVLRAWSRVLEMLTKIRANTPTCRTHTEMVLQFSADKVQEKS